MNLRMNTFFAAFAILMLSSKLLAQEQPNLLSNSKVTTIGYWNIGDKSIYHVTESDTKYKANSDKIARQSKVEYDLELKVVDSTEHTYVFEARYLNQKHETNDQELEKILNSLQMESVIRYQTDEFGTFDTILNLTELKDELVQKLKESKTMVAESKDPEMAKTYTTVIDLFIANFSTLEDVEAMYITDIITIHGIYGFELTLSKPIDLEMIFPTIGNLSLTGTGKLTLISINKAKNLAIMNLSSKPNKEELKEFMFSFITVFMMDKTKKINFKEANVNMSNKLKMTMSLSDGWMESVESSQTAIISDSKDKVKKMSSKLFTRK